MSVTRGMSAAGQLNRLAGNVALAGLLLQSVADELGGIPDLHRGFIYREVSTRTGVPEQYIAKLALHLGLDEHRANSVWRIVKAFKVATDAGEWPSVSVSDQEAAAWAVVMEMGY